MPNTKGPFDGWINKDSGRAFLEYDVDSEPNEAILSVSLFKRTPAEGGLGEKVADGGSEGGKGVAMDLSTSNMEVGTLESGDSPYLRAKKLLSSSPSASEPGELVSASAVSRFARPARERLWRTSVTGVIAGSCGWVTASKVESRGERGGDERAIDLADAVSPSEKRGSEWSSSSSSEWSGSTRKRVLKGEGSGVLWSRADMANVRCAGKYAK